MILKIENSQQYDKRTFDVATRWFLIVFNVRLYFSLHIHVNGLGEGAALDDLQMCHSLLFL